jgi:predicted ATPase
VLSPPAILRRMSRSLDIGGTELADLPERHRSLRSTIAWSYDLLGPDDQALLRHLSVFSGGCTVAAAAAVEADESTDDHESVLRRLTRLADRSLLVAELGPDQDPRFRMLETVRAYAEEQLAAAGELPSARHRHAEVVAALAEAAEAGLLGPRQTEWLERLDREHGNIRAALAWAVEGGDTVAGLRIAGGLWRFWQLRGRLHEGRQALQALLGSADAVLADDRLLARARYAAAHLGWSRCV